MCLSIKMFLLFQIISFCLCVLSSTIMGLFSSQYFNIAIYLQVKAGQNLRLGLGVGCFLGSFLLCFICLLLTPIKLNPVRSIDLGKKIRTSRFKRYHRNNKGQGSCRLSSDSTITFSSPRRNRYGIRLYYMANSVSR